MFGEGSSVRADWRCIGCPMLVGGRKAANSNRGHFFCTSLYECHAMSRKEDGFTQPVNYEDVMFCCRSTGTLPALFQNASS